MSAGIIIRICLEVAAVLLLVVGYLHEEQLIAFEDRMLEKFVRRRKRNTSSRRRHASVGRQKENYSAAENELTGLDRFMQIIRALSYQERKARAEEAAYRRNQAAALKAKRGRAAGEGYFTYVSAKENHRHSSHPSHVA